MSAATSSITTPLLQGQNAIQMSALTREPGPQRQLMDLDQRIQALERELLTGERARNESCKLMLKRAIVRLCCFPYHTAVCACATIVMPLFGLLAIPAKLGCCEDCCARSCMRPISSIYVFCEIYFCCQKEISYPEGPERGVNRYFPDVLCGIDTPIDPMDPDICSDDEFEPSPQRCCCCADCCAGFVEKRVELMQRGLRPRIEDLTSVARLSQRATQVYEAFESVTREGRFTIHPETDVRESFDVPQSLMGIITEYEYEVPAPTDTQMMEIPLSEDHQQMMQIPIPTGRQMTAEEIVAYRQQEWREAELRKRALERAMRKMKADCVKEGVKLPMGLKV